MKKLFALLTAVVMVVCLCACGGNSGDSREDNSNALIGEWICTDSSGDAEKYTFYETGDVKYEFLSDNKTAWFRMGTYKVLSESELRMEIPGKTGNFPYELKGKTLTLTVNGYGDTFQYTKVN